MCYNGVSSPLLQKYIKISICGQQTEQFKEYLRYIQALIQPSALFKVPRKHEAISSTILTNVLGPANENYKPSVNSTMPFETFLYVCFALQWPYCTYKLRIVTFMIG